MRLNNLKTSVGAINFTNLTVQRKPDAENPFTKLMSPLPATNHFDHPFARFILSGESRYRLLRHALLIGVVGFQFANPQSRDRLIRPSIGGWRSMWACLC